MTKKTFLTITTFDKAPTAAADVRPVRSLRPMRSLNNIKSMRPATRQATAVRADSAEAPKQ